MRHYLTNKLDNNNIDRNKNKQIYRKMYTAN